MAWKICIITRLATLVCVCVCVCCEEVGGNDIAKTGAAFLVMSCCFFFFFFFFFFFLNLPLCGGNRVLVLNAWILVVLRIILYSVIGLALEWW